MQHQKQGQWLRDGPLLVDEIGAERFSAVTSDDAANARLARQLLAEKYPWLLIFADPCHQMNNTAKDICGLSFFEDANHKLRVIIRFFRKSSYAAHHFVTMRHIHGVMMGFVAIGKTRFLTFYYAIKALLPCMNLITDLVLTKVIKTTPAHPLHWLTNGFERREFIDTIMLEMALIQPFARSVKCLESSASTPADVALFWVASQATLNDLFTDSIQRSNLFPPSCNQDELISDVVSIVNGRFEEMIQGPDRQVYFTTLFLNPAYLGSNIFTRKDINPLSTKIYLPLRPQDSSASTPVNTVPDNDLRATLPVYELAGRCLAEMLIHEVNSGRAPEIFGAYTSADDIVQEFRYQYMNYVGQVPPFNRYLNAPTPRKYWGKTGLHEDANIMGYLGVKLFSVNPNSMAEERTVSNLTKLNSPDRARQKTSTLIAMTQVKQHELRLKSAAGDAPGPAVRFRDLSDLIKDSRQALPNSRQDGGLAGAEGTGAAADAPITPDPEGGHRTDRFEEPDTWEQDIGLDEVVEQPELGSRRVFEVTERDGINLNALTLLDLLSDEPVDGAIEPATSSATKKTVNTSKVSKDKERLSVAQFEF